MIFRWKTKTAATDEKPPSRTRRVPQEPAIAAPEPTAVGPKTAAHLVAKADAARDAREWAEARANYEHALRIDPDLQHIWIQLGHAAKESGDHFAAECAYRKALQLNPQDADGFLQFGHLMKITGRLAAAFACYRYALALNPQMIDARKEIEAIQRRANRPETRGQRAFQFLHTAAGSTARFNPLGGPDFLGIGMAKAGTGWLFDQLKFNPGFWMPPVKEFGYLRRVTPKLREHAEKRLRVLRNGDTQLLSSWSNRRENDTRDISFLEEAAASIGNPSDLASYASLFRHKENELSGDITPGYGYLEPKAIAEIALALPRTKLILVVRDPIDRAWSRLSMWARLNGFDPGLLENPSAFREFLDTDERFRREAFPTEIYRRWRAHAPNLAIGCFMFDDLVLNPAKFLRDVLVFLGADADSHGDQLAPADNKKANKDKLVMTSAARSVLVDCFREELFAGAETFGGAAATWPARYGIN